MAAQKKPSDGFRSLVEAGLPEFTAEHVALRHPDRFTEKAIEASRKKLTDEGIPLPGDSM